MPEASNTRHGDTAGIAVAVRPTVLPVKSRSRGRPRSRAVDQRIFEATIALLSEGFTLDALSFSLVANRARVGKAAIYRRWSNKRGLVRAALKSLEQRPVRPLPRAGCVHDELVVTLRQLKAWLRESPEARVLPQMMGEIRRDPDLVEGYFVRTLQNERNRLRRVLDHGVATGDLRPDLDTDLVSRMLYGLFVGDLWRLHHQSTGHDLTRAIDDAERAVRELSRGLIAPPVSPLQRQMVSQARAS